MEVKDFTKEEQDKIMMKYAQLAFANLKIFHCERDSP